MFFDVVVLLLGFEPGPLVRAVASCNLRVGGRVIVFMPSFRDERAERAWSDFCRILNMMFNGGRVSVERVEVDLTDIVTAVRRIRSVLNSISNMNTVIVFTGGMRALVLSVFIAYLLVEWKVKPKLKVYLEGRGYTIDIPDLTTVLSLDISREKLRILETLIDKPRTVSEIARKLGKDRSTIHRHIDWLQRKNLVERENKTFKLTSIGKLLT